MPLLNENKSEEEKEQMMLWLKVREIVKKQFGKRPDINAILMLIGINELGVLKEKYEKEEKQDLMHIAICALFEDEGFFKFEGLDKDGWPHYETLTNIPKGKLREQEALLKKKIIQYFQAIKLL
ncbi:MAG: hypothetical protein WCP57_03700 [Bacteroidota bacterium]